MKTAGIIAEYNPFHNGHIYHIDETRKQTGADHIVVVMSGDYVQRGTPAFLDKYSRTRMALAGGADLVLELPLAFSSASAGDFARGGVACLSALGIIDVLSFGSESGDLSLLSRYASLLGEEGPDWKPELDRKLKQGMSYAKARFELLAAKLPDRDRAEASMLLSSPNNILALEYLRALNESGSSIEPFTLARKGSGYHDPGAAAPFSSASGIRKVLSGRADIPEEISPALPPSVYRLLRDSWQRRGPVSEDDFSDYLFLRLCQESADSLTGYLDVTPDLANRIVGCRKEYRTFTGFAELLKTKQYTRTRINRSLLHILLGIRPVDQKLSYLRVLGFSPAGANLLKEIRSVCSLPLLLKMSAAETGLCEDALCRLNKEIMASNLYRHVLMKKYDTTLPTEYTEGIKQSVL
ncbi:nucleotidyltransferase family protein [Anaerolentibacter hominis]|uniref:tRNA(Met) cytidine acetate ligase n=1 Tax=Anaerolentibacter hominis TaxID=3079009 RepID=UPI0031B899C2